MAHEEWVDLRDHYISIEHDLVAKRHLFVWHPKPRIQLNNN